MGAENTPLPDLIELSGLNAFATYTGTPGGGGDILGLVDNATYTDNDSDNSASQINVISDDGTLTIDGVTYSLQVAIPNGSGNPVTVTYDNGASIVDLTDVAFFTASPLGGGSNRYFAVIDDGAGDFTGITAVQTRGIDFNPSSSEAAISASQDNSVSPVCFVAGARILTPNGEVPVETLRPGDLVMTASRGAQPVRVILNRCMSFGAGDVSGKPVMIKAGALAPGLPRRDLLVSPQHRVLIEGAGVRRHCGTFQVLVPAKAMVCRWGIRMMRGKRRVSYIALVLDSHQILFAEGARVESFYAGATAMTMLTPLQRRAVKAAIPGLSEDPEFGHGPKVGRILTRRETGRLLRSVGTVPLQRNLGAGDAAPAHGVMAFEATA